MTSPYLDRPLRTEARYMEERTSLDDRETTLNNLARERHSIDLAASLVPNLEAAHNLCEEIRGIIGAMCDAAASYAPGCDAGTCEVVIAMLEKLNKQIEEICETLED